MIIFDRLKRITIYTGNLGSGKTEVAANTALGLMRRGVKAVLVDLDIINPYFRTRLVRGRLEEMGLQVISNEGKFAFADLPSVSPAVKGVIQNRGLSGVFDVGGDDVGAVALGQYREMLDNRDFSMLLVVNACRPFTRDPEGVIRYLESIENASGLKVSGLVNNTNLGAGTGLDTVLGGHEVVSRTSGITGLPISFTAVRRDLAVAAGQAFGGEANILPLDKFMKTPCEQ